jgi:hypothetical protein
MSRLPTELLFHIIECLIPSNSPLAFPASHVVTRTLLNLCLVSRAIHYAAVRCLFAHCVYIDSPDRLQLLQQTLIDHHLERAFGSSILQQSPIDKDYPAFDLKACLENKPPSLIKSLFLAPFPEDTIDSPEIAQSILSLCTTVGPHLTRLVIDIPLRSLRPGDDTNHVRPFLRAAFQELVALEEFVSIQDELYLDVTERDRNKQDAAVWTTWLNLKRLALYNVDASSEVATLSEISTLDQCFVLNIQRCRNLTHLVLTRSDCLDEVYWPPSQWYIPHENYQISRHLQRMLIVNSARAHWYSPAFTRSRWKQCFVGRVWNSMLKCNGSGVQIVKIDVPVPAGSEDDDIELCQEWVREAAIQGTLWQSEGTPLLVNGDPEEPGGVKIGWQVLGSSVPDLTPNIHSEPE